MYAIAERKGEILGALGIVRGSEKGLPLIDNFRDELLTLYGSALFSPDIAEFTGFAAKARYPHGLMYCLIEACYALGIRDVVFECRDKHSERYSSLGIKPVAGVKRKIFNGNLENPANLMAFNVQDYRNNVIPQNRYASQLYARLRVNDANYENRVEAEGLAKEEAA
jgi:hypothetical protein